MPQKLNLSTSQLDTTLQFCLEADSPDIKKSWLKQISCTQNFIRETIDTVLTAKLAPAEEPNHLGGFLSLMGWGVAPWGTTAGMSIPGKESAIWENLKQNAKL